MKSSLAYNPGSSTCSSLSTLKSLNAQSVTMVTLYPGRVKAMKVFCEVGMGQYSKRGTVGGAKLPVNPVQA